MTRAAHTGLMIVDCIDPPGEPNPLESLKVVSAVYAPMKQIGLKVVALASFGPSSVYAREFYHRSHFAEHDRPRIVPGPYQFDVGKVCDRLSADSHMPHDRCIYIAPAGKSNADMNLEVVEKLGMHTMAILGAVQDTGEPLIQVYNGNIGPIRFLAPPALMYGKVEEIVADWGASRKPPEGAPLSAPQYRFAG